MSKENLLSFKTAALFLESEEADTDDISTLKILSGGTEESLISDDIERLYYKNKESADRFLIEYSDHVCPLGGWVLNFTGNSDAYLQVINCRQAN